MEFCPQAIYWGDVATWMSAVGALIVGAAVVWISLKTKSLAEHANATHQSIQRIEEQRDQDRESALSDRRTLALASISIQVNLARAGVSALVGVITNPESRQSIFNGQATRVLLEQIDGIKKAFPPELQQIAREVRLEEGARLLRAAHIPDTVATLLDSFHNLEPSTRETTYLNIVIFLKLAEKELNTIAAACAEAESQCGMRDVPTPEMLEAVRAARERGH